MEPGEEIGTQAAPEACGCLIITSYFIRWNSEVRSGSTELDPHDSIDDTKAHVIQNSQFDIGAEDRQNMVVVLVHDTSVQNLSDEVQVLKDATHYDELFNSAFLYVAHRNEESNMEGLGIKTRVKDLNIDTKGILF